VRRALAGFVGPKDIFRNEDAIFRYFVPTTGDSPFDLTLTTSGSDFSIMSNDFKIGLYEDQSSSGIEGVLQMIRKYTDFYSSPTFDKVQNITISSYSAALSIIGDPAKRNPQTRQSADHSMIYIISTIIRKAIEYGSDLAKYCDKIENLYKLLIMTPNDYTKEALNNTFTRKIMEKINFVWGGKQFDDLYPEGIPVQLDVNFTNGTNATSGIIMYPCGHSKNTECDIYSLLDHKNEMFLNYTFNNSTSLMTGFLNKLNSMENMTNKELESIYEADITYSKIPFDDEQTLQYLEF